MTDKPMIPKAPGNGWKIPKNYSVKQVIGTGSYGSVVEAFDQEKNRLVAIKRCGHLFEDLIDCKRILRETFILAQLRSEKSESIVKLFETTHEEGSDEIYMMMEICDSDLKKLCRTDVSLSMLHINTLMFNLLAGVKYMHSANVIHRDLKPANCLVMQDCSLKICDFGLARCGIVDLALPESPRDQDVARGPVVAPTQRMKRHLTGHVVTRWYRAPELILLQENYSQQIDMWSAGCIYGELLNMREGINPRDRGPMFPGSSCFPLSPDNKHKTDYKYHTKGKSEQLNMIFNLLGTPSDEESNELQRDDAKRYLKCFSSRECAGLPSKFPGVLATDLEFLGRMLTFCPKKRITPQEALEHATLKDVRDPSKEVTAERKVALEFDSTGGEVDEKTLRSLFRQVCNEVKA